MQLNRLVVLAALLLFAACSEVPVRWDPQGYTVKRGDTLYSIAWRYEKDFRDIAQWNNIKPPYAIYPGQRLVMQAVTRDGTVDAQERPQLLIESSTGKLVEEIPDVKQPAPTMPSEKPAYVVVKKDQTLYSIARQEGYSHHQLARWNYLKSPYVLQPGQKLRLSPPPAALGQQAGVARSQSPVTQSLQPHRIEAKPVTATPVPQPKPAAALPRKVDRWQWPVKGRVTQTFRAGDTSRKGIRISGRTGQGVKAAASGTVVYSGNGLINYGNLVIIKHSHSFLSAYAHNKSLSVKEGDSVKSGQVIAKMGAPERNKGALHFEIRRNGKPVNPLNYLPKS